MREWQSQAHVKHYSRYHVVFVPKYRKKIDIWCTQEEYWRNFPRSVSTVWNRVGRRTCDGGSCAYVIDDTPEVQCGEYHWFSEREVSDTDFQRLFASEKEFHGQALLGSGILRKHGRIR